MKLTKVENLENISDQFQLMRCYFDDGQSSAYILWSYADLMQYVGQEVLCTFRKDMYNGKVEDFVNTLARVGVVHTLERSSGVKLYVDVTDNHSNIRLRDIPEGETTMGAILYVHDFTYGSSSRANWVDLRVQDQMRKLGTIRIFNPSELSEDIRGRYIQCDLKHTQYGFSTDNVVTVDSSFPYSPEVEIAIKFIQDTFAGDPGALKLLADTRYFEYAKKCTWMEPGYILVRLALELDLAAEMTNLLKEADLELVMRALLLDTFEVFQPSSPYHREITVYVTAVQYDFQFKKDVLRCLFSNDPCYNNERALIKQIQSMVSEMIRIKKGA